MVISYAVIALIGGIASCVILWPYGAALALLSMPFGGSLLALIAVALVYVRASGADNRTGRVGYMDACQKSRALGLGAWSKPNLKW